MRNPERDGFATPGDDELTILLCPCKTRVYTTKSNGIGADPKLANVD